MPDHNHIFELLINKDEVSWQSILYELVKSEQMNPWDVDVSLLAQKYIATLRTIKKHDFRISGKVILAAAVLLKMQSTKLVSDEIGEFDRLIAGDFATEQEFYDSLSGNEEGAQIVYDVPELTPRTPQPRNRKVSIYDLVKALQKALEVKRRRLFNNAPPEIHMPEKKRDITLVIRDVYGKIVEYFTTSEEIEKNPLMISKLMGKNPAKEDVVYTILPLLQLSYERKIDLYQQARFGDIEILYPGTKRMEEIKSGEEKSYKEWLANELEKEKKHNEKLKKLRQTLKRKKEVQKEEIKEEEKKEEENEDDEINGPEPPEQESTGLELETSNQITDVPNSMDDTEET